MATAEIRPVAIRKLLLTAEQNFRNFANTIRMVKLDQFLWGRPGFKSESGSDYFLALEYRDR